MVVIGLEENDCFPKKEMIEMVKDREKDLQNILNSGGYPLQIRIGYDIEASSSRHGWKVFFQEKAWKDPETGADGFIDYVLSEKETGGRIIVECKRSLDANWVFFLYHDPIKKQDRIKFLGVDRRNPEKPIFGWDDHGFSPESSESDFCAIRGKGEGDQPILERWSATLLKSLECFAKEELQFPPEKIYNIWYYIPVIVTTARLETCLFHPKDVSLQNGKISKRKFETVPFIRFRKSLATTLTPTVSGLDFKKVSREVDRTIIVVTASELIGFLEKISPK